MLLDQYGKRLDGAEPQPANTVFMRALLRAATKRLPFMNGPAAQVRAVAKECSKSWDWPEEKPLTIKFGNIPSIGGWDGR